MTVDEMNSRLSNLEYIRWRAYHLEYLPWIRENAEIQAKVKQG